MVSPLFSEDVTAQRGPESIAIRKTVGLDCSPSKVRRPRGLIHQGIRAIQDFIKAKPILFGAANVATNDNQRDMQATQGGDTKLDDDRRFRYLWRRMEERTKTNACFHGEIHAIKTDWWPHIECVNTKYAGLWVSV